jgi:protein-tyrosine phosphatase
MSIIYIDTRSVMDTTKSSIKDSFFGIISQNNIVNIVNKTQPLSSFFRNSTCEKYFEKLNTATEVIILIKTEISQFILEFIKENFIKDLPYTICVYTEYVVNIPNENINELRITMSPKRQQLTSVPTTPFIDYYEMYSNVPTEILPGLYLSGVSCVTEDVLDKYNIKTVLSVMTNPPKLDETKYERMIIQIADSTGVNIREHFETTHRFINNALLEKKNILVHCHAGISRSATIVISYIMNLKMMTRLVAHNFVKSKRTIIEPNYGFHLCLDKFEKELLNSKKDEKEEKDRS